MARHKKKPVETPLAGVSNIKNENNGQDIFVDVQRVLNECSSCDANEIYAKLENMTQPDRVQLLINEIKNKGNKMTGGDVLAVKTKHNDIEEPGTSNVTIKTKSDERTTADALLEDMKVIQKVLKNANANEIYAYLEAHHDNPNRIHAVIKEFMSSESQESEPDDVKTNEQNVRDSSYENLQNEVSYLADVFPDCDPNYLFNSLEDLKNDADRVLKVSSKLFESKSYPKLKDRLNNDKTNVEKRRLLNLDIAIPDFIQMYPDVGIFTDEKTPITETYKTLAIAYMKDIYPMLRTKYLSHCLANHTNHFALAYKDIQEKLNAHQQGLYNVNDNYNYNLIFRIINFISKILFTNII